MSARLRKSLELSALSRDGKPPDTHGWCAVSLSEAQAEAVRNLLRANPDKLVDWSTYDVETKPEWPQQRAADIGLKPVRGDLP